ncbi:MAG: hypothetical protein KDA83_03695 [Planctomycetales bacterium]|nr:hypothetical protein [Planctomycetales bacterium]
MTEPACWFAANSLEGCSRHALSVATHSMSRWDGRLDECRDHGSTRNAGPSLQRFSMGMATMRLEKLARLVGMKFVPDRQESIAR